MAHRNQISFPRLIVVPLSIAGGSPFGIQEQIAASHEFDGVRKEKERLTAASLNKKEKEINVDAAIILLTFPSFF